MEKYIKNPTLLLKKKPFTRGVSDDYIQIFLSEEMDDGSLLASVPSYKGKPISQAQYLRELDPNAHTIMYNEDLPKLSSNPNATWSQANFYRAAFPFQRNILLQHSQYVNALAMKLTLLNNKPSDIIKETFTKIKEEWVSRNMDIYKSEIYEAQKSTGDAALLFRFNKNNKLKVRVLSYDKGYTLCPIYNEDEELEVFSFYYSSNGKERIDTYDDEKLYRFIEDKDAENGFRLIDEVKHGFEQIPVVYKKGHVAWEEGQNLIEIYELLYNIYMIIEKKVGFPLLYIIGNAKLDKRSDTAVMLKDSSTGEGSKDAKFLNPAEPAGFENLLKDLFKKIQIATSSILVTADEINISSDISGVALKILRSSVYEKALQDVRDYDEVADKMIELFQEGVSKELGVYTDWNLCKVRAEFQVYNPQSETELVNRLVVQKQSGIISSETATYHSPDALPDERDRLKSEEVVTEEIDKNIKTE